MTRKAAIIILVIVSSIPIRVLAKMQTQKDTPLHHFEMPCITCHESDLVISALRPSSAANVVRIKGNINQLCTTSGCHNFDPMLSHPLAVVQRDAIPSDMALDEHSRLTCLTCHNRPMASDGLDLSDGGLEHLLYRPEGVQFCGKCHLKMGGSALKQSHWQFSTRAHLRSQETQSNGYVNSTQFAGGIDAESRTCLSCHDDVFATIPAYGQIGQRKGQLGRNADDHPIGMDYHQAAAQRAGRFSFLPMVNQQIRLFDSKVGCGSCHSLYAKTKNHLVEPFEKNMLCKKCHLL
ncbi:MAG: hypothetical protein JXN61_07825 [Sedimentisphaerales bacterium]|nr:hypothetical protein [Sedimentisphaerales bacterium]